jgi:signal transduction histidine kinase
VWDLRSHTLEQRGLVVALQELAATLSSDEHGMVKVRTTGEVRRLDSRIEFHLLRVAQEAMTNAVKHGHAALVEVELHYAAAEVRLVVRDNGSGFDPKEPPAGGVHFGLLGMRERAAKVQGELLVESAPGAGTTVSLAVSVQSYDLTEARQTPSPA